MSTEPLDPLIHSLRWIRERPVDHAMIQFRKYIKDHKGYKPKFVRVHYRRIFSANRGWAVA